MAIGASFSKLQKEQRGEETWVKWSVSSAKVSLNDG